MRSRRKTDEIDGNKADIACQDIIDAANRYLARQSFVPKALKRRGGMNDAVCIARRKMLVSNQTLITAGFKPCRGTAK